MSSRAGPSRPTSPTYTAFSGISNYRANTPSFRGPGSAPPVPSGADTRAIARTHFHELNVYLAEYLAREQPNSRSTARQKLTRLTRQQFHELSTDVYDELLRRKNNSSDHTVPFLPVRDDFHPKRNQARQKLATLPTSRFQDLSSDVYYELSRRHPEFKDDAYPSSPGSNYDDAPSSADVVSPRQQPAPLSTAPLIPRSGPGRASQDRGITPIDSPYTPASGLPTDSPYSPEGRRSGNPYSSSMGRRPSDAQSAGYRNTRGSEDPYGGVDDDDVPSRTSLASAGTRRKPSVDQMPSAYKPSSMSDRRRPSEDLNGRRSGERDRAPGRRPSEDQGGWRERDGSDGAASTFGASAQTATATRGEVVPVTSTITEEDFEIPFATGGARDSSGTAGGDQAFGEDDDVGRGGLRSAAADESEYEDEMSPRVGGLSGLAGLSQRLGGSGSGPSSPEETRPAARDYMAAGGARTNAEMDGVKKDYEARIADMQRQMDAMAREAEDAGARADALVKSEARVRQLEEDLALFRLRAEEQGGAMRALERELEDARMAQEQDHAQAARKAEEDAATIRDLAARLDRAEQESEMAQSVGGVNREEVEQVQADMQGLLTELSDLSARNDELLSAKENDMAIIRDLTMQVRDYKRKYEQAKTELRSIKATSQLFLQAPKSDDQLPVAPDGGILDIHMTAFISSVDALLTAGRSPAVTQVLTPMKSVIDAVTAILDDLRTHTEQTRPGDSTPLDGDSARALHERAETTLANLVAATSTHATSAGMAPVSLLDAAASHVSAAVTDIARAVFLRRASRAQMERFAPPTPPSVSFAVAANGHATDLNGARGSTDHHRADSMASVVGLRSPVMRNGRPPSDPSSSNASTSPPPIFDQTPGGGGSDASTAEGDDGWIELKPYLEAQTESVVFAIQAVLSGVRSSTPPPTLSENVTQIIAVVSSIVAVCKDNLPAGATGSGGPSGKEILRELSEHANRLSEALAGEMTKEARQTMAKSSFAVANAMKALAKL